MADAAAPSFGFVAVQSGLAPGDDAIADIVGRFVRALEAVGGQRRTPETAADGPQPLAVLVVTGGTERAILDLWRRRHNAPGEPLLLIAHPGNNSLPAALEVLARLQQDGSPGRIVYLRSPEDAAGSAEIAAALHDVVVRRALGRARIGLVGAPSDWLVASSPDPTTVRAAWGPTVVPVGMEEVTRQIETGSDAAIEPQVRDLVAGAVETREPTSHDLVSAARIFFALQQVVADHNLDALTVRCFDFVQQLRTTGCYALARLSDEGVIAGCEGDLVSTVGMLWARELLGSTPWMANPARLDSDRNTLWLAHCTVPLSLVTDYRLRSHFESGLGVGIQGLLAAGPVTLLRIGGAAMNRVWLAEGELLRSGSSDTLCRTQAEIRLTRGGTVDDLLRTPLGNHLVLVVGHHLDRLRGWCRSVGIEVMASAAALVSRHG